jgi:hypothetical protein
MEKMSTEIADLPGPPEQEFETQEEIHYEKPQQQYHREPNRELHRNQERHYLPEENLYEREGEGSNVRMNIKKNQMEHFEAPGLFDIFKKEINEENVLIFIILFLSTTNYANDYTRKILSMLSFNINTSSTTITLMKCVLLLLIYIIAKNYILPYLKV